MKWFAQNLQARKKRPDAMSGKKILYIINHMDWFWSHRLPLAQGAQNNGFDISVAATGATEDQKLLQYGFKGVELPPSDQGFAPFTVFKIIWAIHNVLLQEKPDIVHAITLKYAFMTGLAAFSHKNVRVVLTIAGLGYLFSGEGLKPKILRTIVGPFLKLALKNGRTTLIFQNPDDMNLMIMRGFANKKQCRLIRGSGVDVSQFVPKTKENHQMPIVLMPTRLVHDKGIAIFIEAARLLKSRGVKARFQIAGGITTNNPLAISASEMKIMVSDGSVEWLGKVSDMPALFSTASIVAYPSWYGEGIPKVLLEAAASGLPIVTTDHPGCREAVINRENGFLVPVKDAIATANAIEILLNNPQERKLMGEKSRKRAEQEFDVHLIVAETLKTYHF